MFLLELFNNDVTDHLQQAALDYLTPLVAQNVPYVTIQSLIDQLRRIHSGLVIDRSLVLSLFKDNQKFIIKGDRIYFEKPDDEKDQEETDAEKNIDKVKNNAIKQAQKNIKSD